MRKSQILNNIFFIFFGNEPDPAQMHGLGRTWPNYVCWAGAASPLQWTSPLFTCNVNSGEANAEGEEGGGGGEGRRLTCGGVEAVLLEATGSSAGGSWWLAVLFFFSLSPLFFVLFSASFFFFFFRPSPSLFSSFSSLFFYSKRVNYIFNSPIK